MKAENRMPEPNRPGPEFMTPLRRFAIATLARNWWAVLLRGILGVLFGIVTFFAPGISFGAIVLVFGAYALADGVLAIISAIRTRAENERWWVLVLEGLIDIAAGIVTILWPGMTALVIIYVIAAWALITGGLEIGTAIRLRKVITHEWWLVLAGIASIAIGVMLALFPGIGALTLMLWVAGYALVFGVLMIGLAFRLRSWGKSAGTA
jgi:uncharacterized membrane protein HdeD (DUF308 family)